MSVMEQIETLKVKHHELEQTLEQLETKTQPDEIKIANIKKEKLRIKDEIALLTK